MSYPFFPPFKTRTVEAGTSSTGSQTITCVVPARAKLISVLVSAGWNQSQTAAATVDIVTLAALSTAAASAPSTISGLGGLSITTTTGGTFLFTPTSATYVNQGDIIQMNSTGTACPQMTCILQEF